MGTPLWAARSELGSGWGMPVFGARGPAGFAVLCGADASARLATGAGVLGAGTASVVGLSADAFSLTTSVVGIAAEVDFKFEAEASLAATGGALHREAR
jgi:hypothetical protein